MLAFGSFFVDISEGAHADVIGSKRCQTTQNEHVHVIEGIGHKNTGVKNIAKKGKAQNGKEDSEFEFHGKSCGAKLGLCLKIKRRKMYQ